MRSSQLLLFSSLLGVAAVLVSTPATADVVNLTTGQTVFADNFEAQTPDQTSHIAYPDPRTSLPAAGPNSASVGSWAVDDGSFVNVQVTDHTGGGDPGPFEGTNYLRIDRANFGSGLAAAVLTSPQTTTGDHLRLSQEIYIGDSAVGGFQLIGSPSAAVLGAGAIINIYADGSGVLQTYQGGGVLTNITGLTYAVGQWQRWNVDYTMGSPTYSLTIDGTTVSGIAINADANIANGIGAFEFTQDFGKTNGVYIDATAAPLLGDINQDGHVNAADILAMEQALTNLPAYQTANGLTNAQLLALGDINGDGVINNADLQSLINLLQSGGGSTINVPEPSTAILLLGAAMILLFAYRNQQHKRSLAITRFVQHCHIVNH